MRKPLSNRLDLVFSTFIEVTGLVTTGASMSRIVTPILSCTCEILGGKRAFAILEDGGLFTRVSFGRQTKLARRPVREERISLSGLGAEIYTRSKVTVLKVTDSPKDLQALFGLDESPRTGTVVGASLRYRRARVGAIGVMIPGSVTPRSEDLDLFELLARQAAAAVKNAREFEKTQTLSITDGLTGAYNYRFLIDALKKEIGIAERFQERFSIIMVDVDGLKEYNDVHGHLGGSEVIKQVARVSSSKIRAIDMLCKYGGDEFVAVLPRTPKPGAATVAERVRDAIEKHKFSGEEVTGKITASFGIASYPDDGITVQDLIASADKALYRAKKHGRNKVWLSGKRAAYSPR
jgi:diguanylate cyclase (GGDEF)-like protein